MNMKNKTIRLLSLIALCVIPIGMAATASEHAQDSKKKFVRVDDKVTLEATEFKFEPNRLEVPVDTEIAITLKNEGIVAHNILIVKDGEKKENPKLASIQKGNKDTLKVKFSETGNYTFYCDVSGHKQAGMTGKIRVVAK